MFGVERGVFFQNDAVRVLGVFPVQILFHVMVNLFDFIAVIYTIRFVFGGLEYTLIRNYWRLLNLHTAGL